MKITFNPISYNTKNTYNFNTQNANKPSFTAYTPYFAKEVLENLINKGYSEPKMAKELGVNIAYVRGDMKHYKLQSQPRQAYYKLINYIKELLLSGMRPTEIARAYGMDKRDVYEVGIKVLGKDGYAEAKSIGKQNLKNVTSTFIQDERETARKSIKNKIGKARPIIEIYDQKITHLPSSPKEEKHFSVQTMCEEVLEEVKLGKSLEEATKEKGYNLRLIKGYVSRQSLKEAQAQGRKYLRMIEKKDLLEKNKQLKEKHVKQAFELLDKGASDVRIAKELGIPVEEVQKILRNNRPDFESYFN